MSNALWCDSMNEIVYVHEKPMANMANQNETMDAWLSLEFVCWWQHVMPMCMSICLRSIHCSTSKCRFESWSSSCKQRAKSWILIIWSHPAAQFTSWHMPLQHTCRFARSVALYASKHESWLLRTAYVWVLDVSYKSCAISPNVVWSVFAVKVDRDNESGVFQQYWLIVTAHAHKCH